MISLMQVRAALPDPPSTGTGWTRVFDAEHVANRIMQVSIIIAISIVAFQLTKIIVRRVVAHQIDEDDPLVRRLREQRAQTMGSLFTNILLVVVVTVAMLTILDVFINIGPLLASVGVVGLAISFGAQSLVKDMISGTFMLIEGQFGIGDVVRVGNISGMVEKITLRTTVLRDLHGAVHIIPNGEITTVSNLTKTWSRAVIDVSVGYREDVDRVIATLRALGEEFYADEQWGELLLETPEVLGVENFAESGIVVRLAAKTLPLKQWEVARELRRQIKKRFDAEGIEIPYPQTVNWNDGSAAALPAPVKT